MNIYVKNNKTNKNKGVALTHSRREQHRAAHISTFMFAPESLYVGSFSSSYYYPTLRQNHFFSSFLCVLFWYLCSVLLCLCFDATTCEPVQCACFEKIKIEEKCLKNEPFGLCSLLFVFFFLHFFIFIGKRLLILVCVSTSMYNVYECIFIYDVCVKCSYTVCLCIKELHIYMNQRSDYWIQFETYKVCFVLCIQMQHFL